MKAKLNGKPLPAATIAEWHPKLPAHGLLHLEFSSKSRAHEGGKRPKSASSERPTSGSSKKNVDVLGGGRLEPIKKHKLYHILDAIRYTDSNHKETWKLDIVKVTEKIK